jgi:hypothetical protein
MISPKSARLTIVVPASVLARLKAQADEQGRSLSNLASLLLQLALHEQGRRDG